MLVTSRRPHPLLVIGWRGNCHHFHHHRHHHHHHHHHHRHHHHHHDVEMGSSSMTCKPGLTQSQADSTAELLFGNSHHDDDVCLWGDPLPTCTVSKKWPTVCMDTIQMCSIVCRDTICQCTTGSRANNGVVDVGGVNTKQQMMMMTSFKFWTLLIYTLLRATGDLKYRFRSRGVELQAGF